MKLLVLRIFVNVFSVNRVYTLYDFMHVRPERINQCANLFIFSTFIYKTFTYTHTYIHRARNIHALHTHTDTLSLSIF